jgi:hypothetical protein
MRSLLTHSLLSLLAATSLSASLRPFVKVFMLWRIGYFIYVQDYFLLLMEGRS